MKNFRKFLAAGVVAVMVFSLAGCGGSKKVTLEGTWKATADTTEAYGAGFDSGMDAGGDRKFSEYIPTLTENITLTLNADKTYTMDMATDVDIEAFQEAYVQYLNDVLTDDNGGTPLTEAELVEVFGTADLKEATAEFFSEEEMNNLFGASTYTGTYSETDGTFELVDDDLGTSAGTFDGQTLTLDLTNYIDMDGIVFTKA